MNKFKKLIYSINKTLGCIWFGMAISYTYIGKLTTALVLLFIVSILFMVGYFAEKWS
jgi:hypothetical protein